MAHELFDRAHDGFAVFNHIDNRAASALNDGSLRDDDGLFEGAHGLRDLHKSPWPQALFFISENRFGLDSARCSVHRVVDEFQFPLEATAVIGQGGRHAGPSIFERSDGIHQVTLR